MITANITHHAPSIRIEQTANQPQEAKKKAGFQKVWDVFCKAMKELWNMIKSLFVKEKKLQAPKLPAYDMPNLDGVEEECLPYYELPLEPKYQEKIHIVVDSLCKNALYVKGNKSQIEAQYDEVSTEVHPLKLIEYIFEFKQSELRTIYQRQFTTFEGPIWGIFLKKIYTSMAQNEDNLDLYLPGFARTLNIDFELLQQKIEAKESWKSFCKDLIEWKLGKNSWSLGTYQSKESTEEKRVSENGRIIPCILDHYLTSYQPVTTNETEKLWIALKRNVPPGKLSIELTAHKELLGQILNLWVFSTLFLWDLERHYPIRTETLQFDTWKSALQDIIKGS